MHVDGVISDAEMIEINKIIDMFPEFKDDLISIRERVFNEESEGYVNYTLLNNIEHLTPDSIENLVLSVGRVFKADNENHPEKQKLMRYIISKCNLPESINQ